MPIQGGVEVRRDGKRHQLQDWGCYIAYMSYDDEVVRTERDEFDLSNEARTGIG